MMISLDIFILATSVLFLLFTLAIVLFVLEKQYADSLFRDMMKYLKDDSDRIKAEIKRLEEIKQTLKDWKEQLWNTV